jgi:hypothetical protein
MSDTQKNTESKQQHRAAPADAANAFFTFQTFWKNEMHRMLDETNAAIERGYGEWERAAHEQNRMSAAAVKSMHDASRQWMQAARTFLG